MSSSWPSVLFMGGMAFFFINAFFAALFMLDPEGVNGLKDAAFIDALSFSVQTFTTVGYGAVTPASAYAHTLVMIEAAFGLLFVAMATGLIFAKVSRPASSVLFSKVVVVNVHHGVPTLSFRLGNARGNDIVEASLKVAALIEELSPEGHTMRRLHDLTLERDMSPLFTLSWTVFHRLDASSPLHGLTADNIDQRMGPIVVTMTGYDVTYAQQNHARKFYYPEDVHFDAKLVDVVSFHDDGRLIIDYDHFHATEPADVLLSSLAVQTGAQTAPGADDASPAPPTGAASGAAEVAGPGPGHES